MNKMQGLTLEDVIDNEESRQIFRNYLVVSHNEDPLSFIDAVEQYERMKSHANRFESAQEMIKTYIEPCARHELNISQVTRSSTMNQFTEQCSRSHCPKNLFDSCSAGVLLELKEDVWPRFINSAYASQMMFLCAPLSPMSPMEEQLNHNTNNNNTNNRNSSSSNNLITDSPNRATTPLTPQTPPTLQLQNSFNNNNNTQSDLDSCSSTDNEDSYLESVFDKNSAYISEDEFKVLKEWTLSSDSTIAGITLNKTLYKKGQYEVYTSKKMLKFSTYSAPGRFLKSIGLINAPVEIVMQAALATEYRLANDKMLVESASIGYVPSNEINKYACTLVYDRYRVPMLSDRDFVGSATLTSETNVRTKCKRYIVVRKSVDLDTSKLKLKAKAVREQGFGCTIFEQLNEGNTKTRYYELGWVTGGVPSWLWERVSSNRGTSYYNSLVKSVEIHMANTNEKGGEKDSAELIRTLNERYK